MYNLHGKVALVTAASKGLGKASALALAREGARIAMSARSEELEAAAAAIRADTGAEILTVKADVSIQEDVQRLVDATLAQFGQIDVLIINAGGPPPGNFLDLQPEDWAAASQLTLMSAVYLSYAVVPHMIARESGSIVAIQSISVKQPIDTTMTMNRSSL